MFRLAAGLLVSVWLARYLGPAQYGLLSYAYVFPLIVSALTSLGLNTLLTSEIPLSTAPGQTNRLVQTAVLLKLIGGLLSFSLIMIPNYYLHYTDSRLFVLVALSAAMLPVQCFDAADVYFQSIGQVQYSVMPKLGAFGLATVARFVGLTNKFDLAYFVLVSLIELFAGCLMVYLLYLRHQKLPLFRIDVDRLLARRLLKLAWPLMLAEFCIFVYMRLDQIMIERMAGSAELGRYSAALRISEAWYFAAGALTASLYPGIIALRSIDYATYLQRYQSLLNLLAGIALGVGVSITLLAGPLTSLLYGSRFAGVDSILRIHIWTGVFIFIGVGSNNWFVVENQQRILLWRTFFGAVINVLLNLVLIPQYGAMGASLATLIAQVGAAYLSNAFSAKTQEVFGLQTRALLFIPRWSLSVFRRALLRLYVP